MCKRGLRTGALCALAATVAVTAVIVRERHGIAAPMVTIWQNFSQERPGKYITPQRRAGYGFEAVWWIKE